MNDYGQGLEVKALRAEVKALETDNPAGEFEAIISTEQLDRDEERIAVGAFAPLPETIPLFIAHDWREKALPVGRGRPYYAGAMLKIRGVFASSTRGQELRGLVNEGIVDGMSVGFLNAQRKNVDGVRTVLKGELFEASFTALPTNTEALILASKTFGGGASSSVSKKEIQRLLLDAYKTLAEATLVETRQLDRGRDTTNVTTLREAKAAAAETRRFVQSLRERL
jgi:HK97 family phage prohead protease